VTSALSFFWNFAFVFWLRMWNLFVLVVSIVSIYHIYSTLQQLCLQFLPLIEYINVGEKKMWSLTCQWPQFVSINNYSVFGIWYFCPACPACLKEYSNRKKCTRQCFSTTGPRPGTGPWHQLYRATRGSPGICHVSFLSSFHE